MFAESVLIWALIRLSIVYEISLAKFNLASFNFISTKDTSFSALAFNSAKLLTSQPNSKEKDKSCSFCRNGCSKGTSAPILPALNSALAVIVSKNAFTFACRSFAICSNSWAFLTCGCSSIAFSINCLSKITSLIAPLSIGFLSLFSLEDKLEFKPLKKMSLLKAKA